MFIRLRRALVDYNDDTHTLEVSTEGLLDLIKGKPKDGAAEKESVDKHHASIVGHMTGKWHAHYEDKRAAKQDLRISSSWNVPSHATLDIEKVKSHTTKLIPYTQLISTLDNLGQLHNAVQRIIALPVPTSRSTARQWSIAASKILNAFKSLTNIECDYETGRVHGTRWMRPVTIPSPKA